MADTMKEIVGFSGNLIFDRSKPNGAPQKLLNVYRINHMGWRYQISLAKEICDVYPWYQSQT
jgi:GDP-L-fucose synthase